MLGVIVHPRETCVLKWLLEGLVFVHMLEFYPITEPKHRFSILTNQRILEDESGNSWRR